MSTATKRRPRLGTIAVGDIINTQDGAGAVKCIEAVRLGRGWDPTPRYHVTDGDFAWWVDRRDVLGVLKRGAVAVKADGTLGPGIHEAVDGAFDE